MDPDATVLGRHLDMTLTVPYLICRCCRQCQSARQRHQAFSTTLYRSQGKNSSYYELLGVKPDATPEEIKRAFFSKSKKFHPDSNPGNPDLHNQFVKLNEAYTVLSKESSRRRYDSGQNPSTPWGPQYSHGTVYRKRPSDFANFRTRSKTYPHEETEYDKWHQWDYHQPWPYSAKERERIRRANKEILHYIMMFMFGSFIVYFLGFKKLWEINGRYLDERNQRLNQIYTEIREEARAKGRKKQLEQLLQKQSQYIQRYYKRCEQQFPGTLVGPDFAKHPAPPVPTAK